MKVYKLEEITLGIFDGKHGGCKQTENTGYYFISVKDLTEYDIDYTNAKQISKNEFDEIYSRTSLENGDVAYANTGDTIGKCVFIKDNPYTASTSFQKSIAVLKPNCDLVVDRYLYYLMKFETSRLREAATGSAQKNLLLSTMRSFTVNIHQIETQKKIVAVLGAIDDKIMNNQKINRNLQDQAQMIFKEWFIDNLENTSWSTGTFSNLIISTLGGDWGKEEEMSNFTEQVFCIRGADIPEVKAGNKGKMPTRFILPKNFASKQLVAGDIVVEISGGSPTQSTGRVASVSQSLLNRYDKGMVCTNFCRALKPKAGYSMFIYYYWQYLYDKGIFFSYENGTTGIKNLDINGFLNNEEIVLPPKELVDRFDDFCQSIFDQIFKNGISTEKLSETRDALLPKLMSGELDVSELEI